MHKINGTYCAQKYSIHGNNDVLAVCMCNCHVYKLCPGKVNLTLYKSQAHNDTISKT